MLELLLRTLEETKSDTCQCGFWVDDVHLSISSYGSRAIYQNEEVIIALIDGKIKNVVWNKLYRKSLFENIYFPKGTLFEDVAVMHQIVDKAKKVVVLSDRKYHYRQRDNSIIQTRTAKNLVECVEATIKRYNYVQSHHPQLFYERKIDLLKIIAMSISRVWRWWYGCNSYEKQRYNQRIEEFKYISQKNFPLLGYPSWPIYLRFSVFFMKSDTNLSFAFLYRLNQCYRRLHRRRGKIPL